MPRLEPNLSDRSASARRPLTVRSSLTNDPLALRGIDGRSFEARRYRDLLIAFVEDLGGPDHASEADKALARQAAGAVVASETLQAKIIAGEAVDLEQMTRVANSASRYLNSLRSRTKANKPKPASPLAAHFANPPTREVRG